MTMQHEIAISVLDNDIWSARSIAQWVEHSSSNFHIAWSTTSAAEALHRCLFSQTVPNILILDMALSDSTGIAVCQQIRKQNSKIGIIGITSYDPKQYLRELSLAGAQALISKEQISSTLNKFLPIVANGETPQPQVFLPAKRAHEILLSETGNTSLSKALSKRELQVLKLYADNVSTQEIATQLGISINTIFTYTHRIMKKLGVNSRTEAIRKCKQYDLFH